jgi:HSP20 family protein
MTETAMADLPVEVKKAPPAPTTTPDIWQSFRGEMDRLFDRFGFSSLRRVFDIEPSWRSASSFGFSAPAIDMNEDENAYKISAELPGIDAKDIDVSVSGDTLVLRAKNARRRRRRTRTIISPSALTARSNARFSCRRASIAIKSPPTFQKGC